MTAPLNERKDRITLVLLAILLLAAAMVFAVTADAPHVPLLAAAGLFVSILLPQPVPRTTRAFVYAGLAVLAAVILEDLIVPVDPQRFFLMPAQYYGPGVIYLGVAATFFDQRDTNLTAVIALALVGTMLAGNAVAAAISNPRFPLSEPVLDHFHLFYGIVVAVQIPALLALLPRVDWRLPVRDRDRRYTWSRRTLRLIGIVAVLAGALGLRQASLYYERLMQRTFTKLFQHYMTRQNQRVVFGRDVDLWRTVPPRQRNDRTVVLRAIAEDAPGYLRGQVFTRYDSGRWTNLNSSDKALDGHRLGGRLAGSVFERTGFAVDSARYPADAALSTLDIFVARGFRGAVLLAPGEAREFELIATGLSESLDGVVRPREWARGAGYTCRGNWPSGATAYPLPTAALEQLPEQEYLQVPAALQPVLARLANEIFTAAPQPGSRAGLAALQRYFQDGYTYKLGVALRRDDDPVIQFLTEQRQGHCELFATASVLLLRTAGIPARYVTGFMCVEHAPEGSYWLARQRDAHAWAEAYVAEGKRWVIVENTPAAGVPAGIPDTAPVRRLRERLAALLQMLFAQVKRGHLAEAVLALAAVIARGLWRFTNHPVRGLLVALCLAFFARRLWVRRRARTSANRASVSPVIRQLQRILRRIEHQVRRRTGICRPATDTVRELSNRLHHARPGADTDVIAELLQEYEMLRYQQKPPSPENVLRFAQKARRQLATARFRDRPS